MTFINTCKMVKMMVKLYKRGKLETSTKKFDSSDMVLLKDHCKMKFRKEDRCF